MKIAWVVGLASLTALLGCAHPQQREMSAVDMRGVLLSTEKLAPPFVVEQRIEGKYAGGDATMNCVVQLADGKLTVVGLTPFGSRAFVIEQKGVTVHFEKFIDRDLPVQPEAVLYDIHRVFFRSLPKPDSDGVREEQQQSELVRETWSHGELTERRFQSLEGPINNIVLVTFEGAPAPIVARHVRVTNAAYRYTLEIENHTQKLLGETTLEVQSAPAPPEAQPLPSVPPSAD